MIKHLLPAVMLTLLMTVLTGLAYPLAMTVIAQRIFPHQANGSLIERDGKVIGSELIGQNFASDVYFHGRPSATTDTDPNDSTKTVPAPYNAANSGGSNLGPTSKALVDRVKDDVQALAAQNPSAPVPVDLVTTSASGLDPDVTPAAALFQIPRVAKARGASEDELRQLVDSATATRLFGVLGEPHVNVLKLNLELDKRFPLREGQESKAPLSESKATQAAEAETAVAETAPSEAETPSSPEPPAAVATAEPPAAAEAAKPSAVETPPSMPVALFPSEISPAHAREKLSVARLKTCTDQFRANAATNANGGMKWGEYWKECKKRLKG